ncbi:MAG: hypothetical protein ACJA13_000330 [Paraglaciecola sp.]|jgi:hypothetical protein
MSCLPVSVSPLSIIEPSSSATFFVSPIYFYDFASRLSAEKTVDILLLDKRQLLSQANSDERI